MRHSLHQVDEITRQAERITSRSLSERLPTINSGDEIERLLKTAYGAPAPIVARAATLVP